jgi:LPS-assembly protein
MRAALLAPALLLAVLLAALAPAARAQEAATLVADSVFINADRTLTAEGAVEVLYKGARLTASRIIYDDATETLTIEGPITVTDPSGVSTLADSGSVSRDLRDGILRGARTVLQEQVQIAGSELRRVGGRYTELSRAVASACKVCPNNPTPLWEIRARRVIHDAEAQMIFFDQAQFRVAGVPVFYVPRLRLPDPTVTRQSGFLRPQFVTASGLGFGVKLPYFLAIDDSRDLTVTPYVSSNNGRTIELRYRQQFRTGGIEFNGALSRDDILPGDTRGYLFGTGAFALPRGFRLRFDIEVVTDDGYLTDYSISNKDRLRNQLRLDRTQLDESIDFGIYEYRSLREGDINAFLPSRVAKLSWERRFPNGPFGGTAGARVDFLGLIRTSDSSADTTGDGVPDGRDMARGSATFDWRRAWTLPSGILASGMAEATFDLYDVRQDPNFDGTFGRAFPAAAVEFRWPFVRAAAGGASDVLEPVAQIVWSPDNLKDSPNEDSILVEFDEGNLFSLDRFPGGDRIEEGLRANLGLSWTRTTATGWALGLTAGRILRADDLGQFSDPTGLSGTTSDWIVAADLRSDTGLQLINRAVFDDNLAVARNELRLNWAISDYSFDASYIWQEQDPAEDRNADTNEIALYAGWQISDGWATNIGTRYDLEANRAAAAGIGLRYTNECTAFDLSLSRRFTSSTSVRPVTDFNVSVVLTGFGSSPSRAARRTCSG